MFAVLLAARHAFPLAILTTFASVTLTAPSTIPLFFTFSHSPSLLLSVSLALTYTLFHFFFFMWLYWLLLVCCGLRPLCRACTTSLTDFQLPRPWQG